MLSLKSFHLFFLAIAIVFTAGFGMWGVLNNYHVLGGICLAAGILLVIYGGYFAAKMQRIH